MSNFNKKIKELQKGTVTWALSKDRIYNGLAALSKAIDRALQQHRREFFVRYIARTLDAKTKQEMGNANRGVVETLVLNVLHSALTDGGYNTNRIEAANVKFMVDVAIRTAITVCNEVSAVAGVQAMKGPVSQLFTMVYKYTDSSGVVTDLDARPIDGYKMENDTRKISLELLSTAIEAWTRKLQAGWTLETAQDMKARNGLDFTNEIVKGVSAELSNEILEGVLAQIIAECPKSTVSFTAPFTEFGTTTTANCITRLVIQISILCNDIARTTRRGAGNFIICSPMVVSMLQSARNCVFAPAIEGSFKGPNNFQLVGTLNGSIKVYMALSGAVGKDSILVGYKGGNGEIDAGFFYAPYVLALSGGIVTNPITFQPVKSLMTRAGSHYQSPSYYRHLTIEDVDFL